MDSALFFLAAGAVGSAIGAVSVAAGRSIARGVAQPDPDGEAWKQTLKRRRETYVGFATAVDQVTRVVARWPATPRSARPDQLGQARGHLGDLRARHTRVLLDSGPTIQDVAASIVADCERLVDGLDLDALPDPGLASFAVRAHGLTLPFLRACREFQEAESDRYFGLRPPRRRMFA